MKRFLAVTACCATCLTFCIDLQVAFTQDQQTKEAKPAVQVDRIDQINAQREKKLTDSIYALTQTASKASDYTEIIEACQTGLKTKALSKKKSDYIKSLEAWAYNRRANARFDLSRDMRSIQNVDQANAILAQAESDYQAALERSPANWRPKNGLGMVNVEKGELFKAIEVFGELTQSIPKKTQGWFNRGETWYQLGQYEKALADYEQVLELNASDLQAMTGKAHSLYQMGEHEKALAEYQVVNRMMPTSHTALLNTGDCHQTLGQWKEAYDCYFSAVSEKPIAEGYQKAAWLLATCPDEEFFRPKMALNLANKAIELGGENVRNFDTLAAAQAANGDLESARKSQELAIAMSGSKEGELHDRLAKYTDGESNQSPERFEKSDNGNLIREQD